MEKQQSPIRVYIGNKKDEWLGSLTIPLPTTSEVLKPFLDSIEIADRQSIRIMDVFVKMAPGENQLDVAVNSIVDGNDSPDILNELNYLAAKISKMGDEEREILTAVLEAKRHCGSLAEIINLTENLGCFDLQPAFYPEQYGEFLITMTQDETYECFERLRASNNDDDRLFVKHIERLEKCVDYGDYGRLVATEQDGVFTERGYLTEYGEFRTVYRGPEDIPPAYRCFASQEVTTQMDKEQFWKIIDDARATAGRWQAMYEPLLESLSKLEAPDIIRWQQIFDEYQKLSYKEKLWAAAAVMHNGCSDDSFDYFRGWLTAQGKDVFFKALADPDSLAAVEAVQAFGREKIDSNFMTPMAGYAEATRFEGMLSIAAEAYKRNPESDGKFYGAVHSNPLPEWEKADIASEVRYAGDMDVKWGGLGKPWPETLEALKKTLPRLYGVFHKGEALQKEAPQAKESVIAKIRTGKLKVKARVINDENKPQTRSGPEL